MAKRISTSLDNLERDQPSTGLDASCKNVLVSLLARRDALFWPWRCSSGNLHSSQILSDIYRKQRDMLSGQVGTKIKADGKSSWKSAHELRQRLIAYKMIVANHSGGQITDVVLTGLGESTARALVGSRVHRFDGVGVLLERLKLLTEELKQQCIFESTLFGQIIQGDPSDFDHLHELTLPLLTAGVAKSVPDTVGHVAFRLIPGATEPVEPTVDVQSDVVYDDLYLKEYERERLALYNAEPSDSCEVYIPMPASGLN